MSFTVRLSSDLISAEAGASVPVAVEVANRAEDADRFELVIEGLDPEWTALPVPSFATEARDDHSEKFFLKPPRASESLAGNYPFVVKVRSLVSGEERTVQGVLQVKPFNHIGMEINPKKGFVSATRRDNAFDVTLMNLGNTEHTVQMFGSDPEEACVFAFQHEQVTLQPGQQKSVEVRVNPTSAPIFASSRLFGFSISARSIESPGVVSSGQAQLEQKPIFTPATVALLFAMVVIAGFWLYLLPKTPTLTLRIDKTHVTVGDSIGISWNAQNATRVELTANRMAIDGGTDTTGATTFQPGQPGTFDIEAVPYRDDKRGAAQDVRVIVDARIVAPDPVIVTARVDKAQVNVGDHFTIEYKFNDAVVRAFIDGMQKDLELKANKYDLVADAAGTRTYTIVALNKDGKQVRSRDLTVAVAQPSKASVVYFKAASKPSADGLVVTIEWQLANAERAELSDGVNAPVVVDKGSGARDFPILKTTTFTLTIYDADGRTNTKTTTVEVKPHIPDKTGDSGVPPVGDGGTTTGGTAP